jgi:Peptidase family M28
MLKTSSNTVASNAENQAMYAAVVSSAAEVISLSPSEASSLIQVRVGDDVFIAAPEANQLETLLGRDAVRDRPVTRNQVSPSEAIMLVIQKGRLFQQYHPRARVLLDRGRYLVVSLQQADAASLCSEPPCYSIMPLAGAVTAYEIRRREALAQRSARDESIASLLERLDMERYKAELLALADFSTRHSLSATYQQAADWALSVFENLGYTVEQQQFAVGGGQSRNVVARKRADGVADPLLVIVCAHLDSINQAGGMTAVAPGADDNASGSAGVLAMARVFSEQLISAELCFVLFGGEEQGLFGSRHFVQQLTDAERHRLAAALNMDMIGNVNTADAAVLLEGSSLSQSVIDQLAAAAEAFTPLVIQTSLNPFNSDHVSFLDADLPSVLTIEGTDSANDFIHTDRDTPDRIEFDLAEQILRMNIAYVARKAQSADGALESAAARFQI